MSGADTLAELEARRTALQAKVDRLSGDQPNDIPGTLITGRSGVPAARTRRLNKQIDRSVDRAVACTKAAQELRAVESRIEWIRSGGKQKLEAQEQRIRFAQEEVFNRIQVGDLVNIGGNHPVQVVRKNRKSITTDMGTRFGVHEIYGIAKGGSDV